MCEDINGLLTILYVDWFDGIIEAVRDRGSRV